MLRNCIMWLLVFRHGMGLVTNYTIQSLKICIDYKVLQSKSAAITTNFLFGFFIFTCHLNDVIANIHVNSNLILSTDARPVHCVRAPHIHVPGSCVITIQHSQAKIQHIGWIWTTRPEWRGLKKQKNKVWKRRQNQMWVIAAGRKGTSPETHEFVLTNVEMCASDRSKWNSLIAFSRGNQTIAKKIAYCGFDWEHV